MSFKRTAFLLLLFGQITLTGQDFPFWGSLPKGKFMVGYTDTVLWNSKVDYKYGEYQGPKPYLISVWYPAVDNLKRPYMKFSDYMDYRRFTRAKVIIDSLRVKYDAIYIRDAIAKSMAGMQYKELGFGKEQRRLFKDVQKSIVYAKRNLVRVGDDLPCIYYHHGAQSTSFDNIVFCEYMASNGYIVISSNYLWPIENKRHLGSAGDAVADMAFVISNTKSFLGQRTPYQIAAGHSWGAQLLLLSDTLDQKPFRQIIAFHTTLEDKPVDRAQKMWPELMPVLQNKNASMTTPTVIFAPEFRIKDGFDFLPFRENKTTPYTFITVKTKYLSHDGFVTLGNLRAPFAGKYKFDDSFEISTQHSYYQQILVLTKLLIETPLNNNSEDISRFKENFDVRKINEK
jgi:hypothetical protein